MKKERDIFVLVLSIAISTGCILVSPYEDATSISLPKADPVVKYQEPSPVPLDLSACEESLSWILAESEVNLYSNDDLSDIYQLVTYEVISDELVNPEYGFAPAELIPYQDDAVRQQQIWEFASLMMPANARPQVNLFMVYTDGEGDSLGAVFREGVNSWLLAVDIQDAEDIEEYSLTLIHEIAHLLSLNNSQMAVNINLLENPEDEELYYEAMENCSTFFVFPGCTTPDSYLNRFFQEFWSDIYAEWQAIDSADTWEEYYTGLDDFYKDHEMEFVSSYAVTSPVEDIAESFTYFVFSPRPDGGLTSQDKILFFYDYPELVSLRAEMLKTICFERP